ncbi:MAG: hypothetical protein KGJ90_04095 [Patescibacteria group bacterium]|nr:hypothetical protein [Patescibacteria group bacterium]
MKSYTDLQNYFNIFSLNSAPSNSTLSGILLSDGHRYLLQKYFDNEGTVYIRTVGPQKTTLASSFGANGATSATLATAWNHTSGNELVVFSSGEQRTVSFVQGSTAIRWSPPLLGSFDGNITSASPTNDTITYTMNSVGYITSTISNGNPVIFTGSSLPGGITAGTEYYFGTVTATTAQLFTDSGLTTKVDITSTGTGTFTSVITTAIATMGAQSYLLPNNVSKIRNSTITVGQLVYTPAPINTIQEWTKINALPYDSSIPGYFFVWQRELNFWPIPSDFGDVITINCQIKAPDFSYSDYSTGNITTASAGSNVIVGTGTSWGTQYPTGVDIGSQNLYLTINMPYGDGLGYKIQSVTDDTHLTLYKPLVSAPQINSSTTYKIGQYPMLFDDFHDLIGIWALKQYYASIVKDTDKFQMWDGLLKERLQFMEGYLATKSVNVDLSVTPVMNNPNMYTYYPPDVA